METQTIVTRLLDPSLFRKHAVLSVETVALDPSTYFDTSISTPTSTRSSFDTKLFFFFDELDINYRKA